MKLKSWLKELPYTLLTRRKTIKKHRRRNKPFFYDLNSVP